MSPSGAGAASRLVRILIFALALAAWGWPLLAAAATTVFPRAEAVRSDWNASEPQTVECHIKNIFRKMSVSTRTEAVDKARQRGLLH